MIVKKLIGNKMCIRDSGKVAAHDRLRNVEDINLGGGKVVADPGDDADLVLTNGSNNCFHEDHLNGYNLL